MKKLTVLFALLASPSYAAGGGSFFALDNTDFVVTLAFLAFIGVLLFVGVPRILGGLLDQRAEGIRNDLDEAKQLREDAQSLLASYERKQEEVKDQADRIVSHAKAEAETAAAAAKEALKVSIERRMQAAEDQIASAEAAAVKEVRDSAVTVAVAAAGEVIAKGMKAADANKLIDSAIADAEAKLH